MLFIIILGIIILSCIISEASNDKPKVTRRLVAYNIHTGQPIYLDQCRFVGYDPQNGNPMFENPFKIVKYNSQTGVPIYDMFEIDKMEFNGNNPVYGYKAPVVNNKKVYTDEEKNRISNSILMIVGALLIVVASIIFLASSWETISGFIKVLVLVLIQLMFIFFGYICKNKLNVNRVAKVFNYLALCFVPIILLSLSSFELIGSYFSINGEGFLLYFALSFLISDILYKVVGWIKKDVVSKIMSLFVESMAIIFALIHLQICYEAILFVLAIYNVLLYILMNGNYLDKKAYKIPLNILSYIVIFLLAITMMASNNLIVYLAMITYTIYYYVLHISSKEKADRVYNLVFFIITYVINLSIVNKFEISPYFVYILSIIPLVLLTKVLNNKNTRNVLYNVEAAVGLIFILDALNFPSKTMYYLLTFVAGLLFYLILLVLSKNSLYKMACYIMFTAIFIDIFYISDLMEYAKYLPLVSIILVYSFELIFDKLKDVYSQIFIISLLIIESFLLAETYFVLLPLVLMLGYIKLEKLEETLLIVPMLTSMSLFWMDDNNITIILSYVLISIYTLMSLLKGKIGIYTVASLLSIIAAGWVFDYKSYVFFAILLVWSIIHLIRNYKEKNYFLKFVNICSLLGLYISGLNYFDVSLTSLYVIGYYMAVIAISVYVLSFIKDDFDMFIGCFFFAVISLVCFFVIKQVNDALILMLFLFLVSILSFVKKWRYYLYESLIVMVINIIYLTAEFWAQIPWYFYILIIGMGLIVFAMFDEKNKQKKKLNMQNNNSNLPSNNYGMQGNGLNQQNNYGVQGNNLNQQNNNYGVQNNGLNQQSNSYDLPNNNLSTQDTSSNLQNSSVSTQNDKEQEVGINENDALPELKENIQEDKKQEEEISLVMSKEEIVKKEAIPAIKKQPVRRTTRRNKNYGKDKSERKEN